MRIMVISDVHIDSNPWSWDLVDSVADREVSTVIVAGDVSNDVFETSRWLVELRQRFENVIWVAGNHDFYNLGFHQTRLHDPAWSARWPYPRTVEEMLDHYSRWSEHNGIHFLHRSSVSIDGVTFIGATGWHDYVAGTPYPASMQIDAWYNIINDHHICWRHPWNPDHLAPYDAGVRDADRIHELVGKSDGNMVVITHHVPHRQCLHLRPENPAWTMLHGSFANTRLERVVNDRIGHWIYGHTHLRGMKTIGNTTYLCNPRGYPGENPGWEPVFIDV